MEEMSVTLGRDPTITELSAKLGVETTELAAALESAGQVESLSQTIYRGDGNEICLMDKLEEDRDGEQETVDRMVIAQLLEGLEERDRTLIRMRYYEDKTQTQVAKIMGVSQVQISRIEKKILRSMRDKINGT
jgi:RNA polymerase sporulation-specific sigma factor